MDGGPDELRAVLEQMPESIAIYDLDGRIVYLNPATERIFGFTLSERRGQCLWELFPEAIGNPFHQAFQRVAAGGGTETFDHYYPPFDRWFANRITRVGQHVHVVARDVTDEVRQRRRLEALARISAVLTADHLGFDAVLQTAADALTQMLDADCMLTLLSADGRWLEVAALATRDDAAREIGAPLRRFSARDGPAGEALSTRSAVLAGPLDGTTLAGSHGGDDLRDIIDRYRPGSVLAAPLVLGEQAIGVMIAARRREARPLTADDRTLVTEIAPSLALYIAHVQRRVEATSLRRRLEAVTDSNPALVSFIDRDERYQYVNASYEQWFGRPREDFIGRTLEEMLGPDAYRAIAPYVRAALSGTQVNYRTAVPYPHGLRHVDAHCQPMRGTDGAVEGFAAIVLDVTAEEHLSEHERARLGAERRLVQRLESVLELTGKLARADSADEIARIAVDEGVTALDANLAGLWLLSPDQNALALQREHGFQPRHVDALSRIQLHDAGPISDAVATMRPVWIESRADYAARYPVFEPRHRPDPAPPIAFVILPLVIEGRVAGCMNFTFYDERRLAPDERAYLELLASHVAEALRRTRLYAELRDVSETRKAIIEASPAAIMLLDAEGVVHAWNSAAERIFGWSAAEALGHSLPSVPDDQRAGFLGNLAQVLSGDVIHGRAAQRVRKNGEPFDVELYAVPVRLSDGRTLCLSMVFDVSERARRERGRRLVEEASAILTRSLDWEQTLRQVVELPVREFADGCAVDLRIDFGTPRAAAGCDPGEPGVRSTLSVPLAVGERVLGVMVLASRTRGFDDLDRAIVKELASHAAAAIDNARLYHEARAARREAEAASRAKDLFLAMLGHELRNPLAPITTALHLMRLRARGQLERERAVIERQVAHLSRLVDDLLDVSRITRGKIELRRERCAVSAVVAKAIEITSPLLEQRRHKLSIDVPPDLIVLGDLTRLAQVVANLLSNAAKYTEPGGNIEVRAVRRDGEIALSVRDDGMGIAPEMLGSIFEMFMQAPQPSARTEGGLGLGLAIVRSLVELHGGRVSAYSEGPGKGSELTVFVPAAPVEADERATESWPASRRSSSALRVLVVDDNKDAAVLMAEALGAHGHEIRTAFDGPSALRIAEQFRPQVAVLDIGLPVMDGYELVQRLRAIPDITPQRFIAVTGYGQESDRARSLAAGFDAHVAKPVSIEVLVRLLDEAR